MVLRKTLLATAVLALAATPAWALPAGAESNSGSTHRPASTPVGPPSSTPNYSSNPGSANRSETGTQQAGGGEQRSAHGEQSSGANPSNVSSSGKGHSSNPSDLGHKGDGGPSSSHKCKPHGVAYVAAGTLVSWTLTEEEGSKRHAYHGEVTVEVQRTNHHARADKGETVTYKVEGAHVHGPVAVEDLAAGDQVRVIGKITTLAKRCASEEFTPTTEVRRLVFHAPRHQTVTTTTTTSTSAG